MDVQWKLVEKPEIHKERKPTRKPSNSKTTPEKTRLLRLLPRHSSCSSTTTLLILLRSSSAPGCISMWLAPCRVAKMAGNIDPQKGDPCLFFVFLWSIFALLVRYVLWPRPIPSALSSAVSSFPPSLHHPPAVATTSLRARFPDAGPCLFSFLGVCPCMVSL